jgi:hypothetical protein
MTDRIRMIRHPLKCNPCSIEGFLTPEVHFCSPEPETPESPISPDSFL